MGSVLVRRPLTILYNSLRRQARGPVLKQTFVEDLQDIPLCSLPDVAGRKLNMASG